MHKVTVDVVSSDEDMLQVKALREEIFIREGGEPPEEQWDGNDYSSSHLIMRLHGSGELESGKLLGNDNSIAIGCMRIRHIEGDQGRTAVWERMATLKEYRKYGGFAQLLEIAHLYTFDFKGFSRIIGIVEDERLHRIYTKKYGFRFTGEEAQVYRGHKYYPMEYTKPPSQKNHLIKLQYALLPEAERFRNFLENCKKHLAA